MSLECMIWPPNAEYHGRRRRGGGGGGYEVTSIETSRVRKESICEGRLASGLKGWDIGLLKKWDFIS